MNAVKTNVHSTTCLSLILLKFHSLALSAFQDRHFRAMAALYREAASLIHSTAALKERAAKAGLRHEEIQAVRFAESLFSTCFHWGQRAWRNEPSFITPTKQGIRGTHFSRKFKTHQGPQKEKVAKENKKFGQLKITMNLIFPYSQTCSNTTAHLFCGSIVVSRRSLRTIRKKMRGKAVLAGLPAARWIRFYICQKNRLCGASRCRSPRKGFTFYSFFSLLCLLFLFGFFVFLWFL